MAGFSFVIAHQIIKECPMRILVVDDNADYLTLMRDELVANGYTVFTGEDGEEAIRLLGQHDIDLIISDIRMPRLDGLKLHAYAREMDRYRRTVFIFVSAFKEVYKEFLQLDPTADFFFDKSTPLASIVGFINNLTFGRILTIRREEEM
jgi:DNA-binding response OmpR family regulator